MFLAPGTLLARKAILPFLQLLVAALEVEARAVRRQPYGTSLQLHKAGRLQYWQAHEQADTFATRPEPCVQSSRRLRQATASQNIGQTKAGAWMEADGWPLTVRSFMPVFIQGMAPSSQQEARRPVGVGDFR